MKDTNLCRKFIKYFALFVFLLINTTIVIAQDTKEWTIMVYIDADNNLESFGFDDLNEMETVGSDKNVSIIVLMDTYSGSAKIYNVTQDDSDSINSPVLEDWGEVNMGDPRTLIDFVDYVVTNFPAEKYALIIWDHGAGWKGSLPVKGVSWDETNNYDYLTLDELRDALSSIYSSKNITFDLIGFDACLMGMIEVAFQIRDFGKVMVASQETEPASGWVYNEFLQSLTTNPSMSSEDLAKAIIDSYIQYTQSGSITLSAVDLTRVDELAWSVDWFSYQLKNKLPFIRDEISQIRSEVEEFYFTEYIDLYHFAEKVGERIPEIYSADDVLESINQTVIYERHGSYHSNAHGISIYFPSSEDYYESEYEELLFCWYTDWDEFLRVYYSPGNWIIEGGAETWQVEPGQDITLWAVAFAPNFRPLERINVTFVIEKPDSTVDTISTQTNENGFAKVSFEPKDVGMYSLTIKIGDYELYDTFYVENFDVKWKNYVVGSQENDLNVSFLLVSPMTLEKLEGTVNITLHFENSSQSCLAELNNSVAKCSFENITEKGWITVNDTWAGWISVKSVFGDLLPSYTYARAGENITFIFTSYDTAHKPFKGNFTVKVEKFKLPDVRRLMRELPKIGWKVYSNQQLSRKEIESLKEYKNGETEFSISTNGHGIAIVNVTIPENVTYLVVSIYYGNEYVTSAWIDAYSRPILFSERFPSKVKFAKTQKNIPSLYLWCDWEVAWSRVRDNSIECEVYLSPKSEYNVSYQKIYVFTSNGQEEVITTDEYGFATFTLSAPERSQYLYVYAISKYDDDWDYVRIIPAVPLTRMEVKGSQLNINITFCTNSYCEEYISPLRFVLEIEKTIDYYTLETVQSIYEEAILSNTTSISLSLSDYGTYETYFYGGYYGWNEVNFLPFNITIGKQINEPGKALVPINVSSLDDIPLNGTLFMLKRECFWYCEEYDSIVVCQYISKPVVMIENVTNGYTVSTFEAPPIENEVTKEWIQYGFATENYVSAISEFGVSFGPDLTIVNVSVHPNPLVGRKVPINLTLKNIGTNNVTCEFTLDLFAEDPYGSVETLTYTVDGLGAGETKTIEASFVPQEKGKYKLRAVVALCFGFEISKPVTSRNGGGGGSGVVVVPIPMPYMGCELNYTNNELNFTINVREIKIMINEVKSIKQTAYPNGTDYIEIQFNITIEGGNSIRFKLSPLCNENNICYTPTGRTKIFYEDMNNVTRSYNVTTFYDESQKIYPLKDYDEDEDTITSMFTLRIDIPEGMVAGRYTSRYGIGIYFISENHG